MKAYQKTKVFESHVNEYEAWYEKYPEVYQSEIQALREHFRRLPESIQGIEVGLGTGRFAEPLGIKEGVEPSEPMAERARKRGIEVMDARAEHLPYKPPICIRGGASGTSKWRIDHYRVPPEGSVGCQGISGKAGGKYLLQKSKLL